MIKFQMEDGTEIGNLVHGYRPAKGDTIRLGLDTFLVVDAVLFGAVGYVKPDHGNGYNAIQIENGTVVLRKVLVAS